MEVEKENRTNENSLALREITIIKTDLELSQQLRSILTSFEQEILVNNTYTTMMTYQNNMF